MAYQVDPGAYNKIGGAALGIAHVAAQAAEIGKQGALVASGFIPGPGELQDAYAVVSSNSSTRDRVLSAASLGINFLTGGAAPNYSGVRRAVEASGEFASVPRTAVAPLGIVDKSYKLKIHGTAQKTKTPGHQFRTYREAILEAKKPNVQSVHLDFGYNRGLDLDPKTISPNRRPDVLSIYDNGVVRLT